MTDILYLHFTKIHLSFRFRNLNPCKYSGDSLSAMCSGFLTVSDRLPWCFSMFSQVFRRVFLLFPLSVSPVSYFRFRDILYSLYILRVFMWQLETQVFASSYIWLAYIFEVSYSTVVTSSAKKQVSTNQSSRNKWCLIVGCTL